MTLALFGGAPVVDRGAHRTWPEVGDSQLEGVSRVLSRGVLSGASAPEAAAFQREMAKYTRATYALLTHSGTSALHLALAAAGISAGDHVVVPAYSFVATPLSVLHAGAIPIFADVDERSGLIDPETIPLTSRTRAIMPVHMHGCAADMAPLLDLCRRRDLVLVEDAAQAHGATWQGNPAGSLGDVAAFSLQSSKNLGAGEGGVLTTSDEKIAASAHRLRNFGQDVGLDDAFDPERPLDGTRPLESTRVGWMYRGNELLAAFARAGLAELPGRTERCQRNAERLSARLAKLEGISPPFVPVGSTSVFHKYRVRHDGSIPRDLLVKALRAEGLDVVLWQVAPLPAQAVFRAREGFGGGFPWSLDRDTDWESLYRPDRFPATQRLLDRSIVLFSQTCPLIAQDEAMVDKYAEAFERVWSARTEIVRRA